ncbi:MAG: metal ABC transporter permease [Ruminococcaceae bacterium]|nr:metal ABC transporter permease [Oscillospiraceae bacterium]
MFDIFSYSFMQYALIVGVLVSLCAALLGVLLVLRRYSMIGDGLSHVGFGALSVAYALSMAPMALAVPVVVVSAFILLGMSESKKIKGDSAIAVLSSSALAIGVVANSIAGGSASDLGGYLFGSILTLKKSDVILSAVLSLVVILLFVLFKNRIFAVTFDMPFAKSAGVHVKVYNMLLALLIALTVVVGMQIVGTMLISSLIIFPALSAMQIADSFKGVIILSAVISIFSFVVGLLVSLTLPAGAMIVLCNLAVLLVCTVIGKIIKR